MRQAWCLIREGPHYRRNAFLQGLRHAGYEPSVNQPPDAKHGGDLLIIWNRYGDGHEHALRFERAGGRVIVSENGYAGRDAQGRQYYALSRDWHQRPLLEPGIGARFSLLGLTPAPWRASAPHGHILICAQRGFGVKPHCMEKRWPGQIANELRKYTKRPIRIRPHPEDRDVPPQDRSRRPLADDLVGAHAVVVWSSTAAVKALLSGIPVFHCGPDFIVADAAQFGIEGIEAPRMGDRAPALERMAWGQWSVEEIERGLPFKLMDREPAVEPASAHA